MILPVKITPCPISEALVQVLFSTSIPPDAVFGIVFKEIRSEFGKSQKLPITNVPANIRENDIKLKYQPTYSLTNDDVVLQIGPRTISFHCTGEYLGWESFSEKIYSILSKLQGTGLIEKGERISIRYINVFDGDIITKTNLRVEFSNANFTMQNLLLKTEIPAEPFLNVLHIVNPADLRIRGKKLHGSVIDIDTIYKRRVGDFYKEYIEIIENAHIEEKKLFFSILNKEFLDQLNPEYKG